MALGITLAFAVAGISPGFAQAPAVTLVEPAAPLLPKQFGAWQQQADVAAGQPDAATKDVLLEDGLARFADSTYKRGDGNETVEIKAYQFGDVTGAYSAFTYLRTPDERPLKAGASATLSAEVLQRDDSLLIQAGPDVLVAEFHGGQRFGELADLISGLPKATGAKGLPPPLPTMLPAKGLQAESVKYALGSAGYEATGGVLPASVVGFDKSAEVATAKYAGRGTLTLLLYPTPQIAGDHLRQIEAYMKTVGPSAGTVALRREGPLVKLITGVWTEADARAMVENIHLRNEITFDKKMPLEFHAEIQKTYSLLTSIAVFCGVGALAAVILGLFLGYGRAAVRVLQGKPAASEPEFLRIDLRGPAAPIHPDGPGQPG